MSNQKLLILYLLLLLNQFFSAIIVFFPSVIYVYHDKTKLLCEKLNGSYRLVNALLKLLDPVIL